VDKRARAKSLVYQWHARAQLDYSDLYLRLYISYNAWYGVVTCTDFDREAIARLKRRVGIWSQYIQGSTMAELRSVMTRLSTLTVATPMTVTNGKWQGVISHPDDWQNLIEFWYQVRCCLFHGNAQSDERFATFVQLAYVSLNIFMSEVIARMKASATDEDVRLLGDIEQLSLDDSNTQMLEIRRLLRRKYINSRDPWNVDV